MLMVLLLLPKRAKDVHTCNMFEPAVELTKTLLNDVQQRQGMVSNCMQQMVLVKFIIV